MGRSQETFNKKEKEKKKMQKRKDKLHKKEERKANSNKGKDIEEMLAYVDENGNITSTPPDPKKKKEISKEEIQIGIPKQEALMQADVVRIGTVAFFNDSKGYGFIKDQETQETLFVHINGLVDQIKEGNRVTFEVEKGPKGLNAVNVKLDK